MADLIMNALGRALSWQVTQFTLAFVLAWRTIRPDIMKEIGARLTGVIGAIDKVGSELTEVKTAVTADMALTSKRLELIEDNHGDIKSSLDLLKARVAALELKRLNGGVNDAGR